MARSIDVAWSFIVFATLICWTQACSAQGQEPSWYPRVIAPPEMRTVIQATPVEFRPYRPLHFWGNTVRRTYYRGSPVPMPRDVVQTGVNLVTPVAPIIERPTSRFFSR